MRYIFTTNLDLDWPEYWPENLICRPLKGDRVEAKSGLILEVHSCKFESNGSMRVELHLPKGRFQTIREFNEWYRKWRPSAASR